MIYTHDHIPLDGKNEPKKVLMKHCNKQTSIITDDTTRKPCYKPGTHYLQDLVQ